MTEKRFSCDNEGLVGAKALLESVCDAPKPAIVTDEIVSNIIRCSGASGFTIGIDCLEGGGLRLVFVDDGKEFDPTKDAETPDVSAVAEDRPIGGLGIFMVKKMSKSVAYRRDGGKNVLTVLF